MKPFKCAVRYVGLPCWQHVGDVQADDLSDALRIARARHRLPFRVRVTDPETGERVATSRPAPPRRCPHPKSTAPAAPNPKEADTMRNPTIVDYGPRLAAIEAHRHPARIYCDRKPPDPARPFGYRCPTCRYSSTAGKVARYADGVRTLETCDRCDGRGWLFVAHPSAVPVRREYAPAFDVAAHPYGATRYDVWDAYHLTTPTPREAWTAEDRDAYKLWATGEDWRPVVWRLPHARGFLAGWRSESSGTVAWDPEVFPADDGDPDGTECPRDAIRRARDMAERAAEEQSEDLAACEYATEEGRKDGAAGKLAEDFGASNVSRDYRDVWEEARADAYARAAEEAGERDGRNGDPAAPETWPTATADYWRGFDAGREALREAALNAAIWDHRDAPESATLRRLLSRAAIAQSREGTA